MPFWWERWTQRYTRVLLGAIVALLALSLVITFGPGIGEAGDDRGNAGKFYLFDKKEVQVSRREFSEMYRRAFTMARLRAMLWAVDPNWYCGKLVIDRWLLGRNPFEGPFRDLYFATIVQNPQNAPAVDYYRLEETTTISEDILRQVTWDSLILLAYAKELQIKIPEKEFQDKLERFVRYWRQGRYTDEDRRQLVASISGLPGPEFERAFEDSLLIAKLLQLYNEVEFPEYQEMYKNTLQNTRKMRVLYTTIDPNDPKYLRAVTTPKREEIERYYRKNKARFRAKEMAQVVVVGAFYDDWKQRIADPDEKTLKDLYEKHKTEYKEGDKQLDFEQAKEKVKDKYKQAKAQEELTDNAGPIWELHRAIRSGIEALKQEDRNDAAKVLDVIENALRPLGDRGIPLKRTVTIPFTRREAPDVKKQIRLTDGSVKDLGEKSTMDQFAFDSRKKVGDVSNPDSKSDQGVFIYMIQAKQGAKELPLTRQVEDVITQILRREQVARRVEKEVQDVVAIINQEPTEDEIRRYYEQNKDKYKQGDRQQSLEEVKPLVRNDLRAKQPITDPFAGLAAAGRKFKLSFKSTDYFAPPPKGGNPWLMRSQGEPTGVEEPEIDQAIRSVVGNLTEMGRAASTPAQRERKPIQVIVVVEDFYYAPVENIEASVESKRGEEITKARTLAKRKWREAQIEGAKLDDKLTEKSEKSEPSHPDDHKDHEHE